MKKREIDLFNKGREIAENISEIMLDKETGEKERLNEWMTENRYSKQVLETLTNKSQLEEACLNFSTDKSKHIERLSKALEQKRKQRIRGRLIVSTAAAAAVAILSFLVLDYREESHSTAQVTVAEAIDQKPGEGRKPLLITGSGKEIALMENLTLNNDGAVVTGGHLKYDKEREQESNITYNKLVIPEKLTFSVELSDGTKVYLNANSTLEYPTQFSGSTREIRLTGEAYFDVTKDDKKPFIVRTPHTKIQVYGTKFNVNSYNEKSVKTALLSGSVGVQVEGKKEIKIVPGQQLTMNTENGESFLTHVNVNKYEAWMNGYFRCDNEAIELILEDIAKWYGVEFFFESSAFRQIKISASINRNCSIDEVMELLSITSEVQIVKKGGIYHIVK